MSSISPNDMAPIPDNAYQKQQQVTNRTQLGKTVQRNPRHNKISKTSNILAILNVENLSLKIT